MDFYLLLKKWVNVMANRYGQKLLDSARKSTTDAIKIESKRAIQKTAEATGDLIGNKIADKITNVFRKNFLIIIIMIIIIIIIIIIIMKI